MKVFISGSISIKKLPKCALEKLDNIINREYSILIGDAKGVDSLVQKYLLKKKYRNITVHYAGKRIRHNYGNWNTRKIDSTNNEKGRELYTLKDIAMANDTDYGLMIWDWKSEGTLNNINMMKKSNKKFFVVIEEMIVDEKQVDSILEINKNQQITNQMQLDLF
ncbi:MAG: hypothetical protein ABIN18_09915 [Pseudomonadota bacterium]